MRAGLRADKDQTLKYGITSHMREDCAVFEFIKLPLEIWMSLLPSLLGCE